MNARHHARLKVLGVRLRKRGQAKKARSLKKKKERPKSSENVNSGKNPNRNGERRQQLGRRTCEDWEGKKPVGGRESTIKKKKKSEAILSQGED